MLHSPHLWSPSLPGAAKCAQLVVQRTSPYLLSRAKYCVTPHSLPYVQTAPKYDVLFMDFGNREHVAAGQVRVLLVGMPASVLCLRWGQWWS